jgi:hypothetical protein
VIDDLADISQVDILRVDESFYWRDHSRSSRVRTCSADRVKREVQQQRLSIAGTSLLIKRYCSKFGSMKPLEPEMDN